MFLFVAKEGIFAFSRFGLNFVLGQRWATKYNMYGAFPLIYGSLMVVFGALMISVPLGVSTSIFIMEVLPFSVRDVFLAPFIASVFCLFSGENALTASLILAVMAIPTIVGVSGEIIAAVPRDYKEAALALGATRWQTIKSVVLPLSKSGILASIMLGFGRAIGETIAVRMVAGNVAKISTPLWNYLDPVYPITAVIAMQMGESAVGSLEYSALFGLGLILFMITFAVNTFADLTVKKGPLKRGVKL